MDEGHKLKGPQISPGGTRGIGPDSPVQKALYWIQEFFSDPPRPDIDTDSANSNGALIGVHLLHLIKGCGLLNGTGDHSAAVNLLRAMEDTLDCFAAVTLVSGAAEEWANDKLKASEAAKQWTEVPLDIFDASTSLPEYRKYLRGAFNKYSHCSRELCNWNLYFSPHLKNMETGKLRGTIKLNILPHIIDNNGHSIDAFVTAHLLEFMAILKKAYSKALSVRLASLEDLNIFEEAIVEIMEKHNTHHCQEVRVPPELARLE